MPQYDAAAVRERLTAERDRLRSDIYERTEGAEAVLPVDPLNDSGGMASDQADDADAMADAERNQAIIRNSQALLEQVNAALARLDAGTYGICANCGKEINPRRLERAPYATLCIDCQAKLER
ncbi:MAG TPA: TraR/DksA C4-type zinc finger protein [Ktedonobacterales bacterium]|jgi:DnaK suppressor protein|nr:TraR/DksA C4-type zinc finger protein [Ktedonobacterales bacterium]